MTYILFSIPYDAATFISLSISTSLLNYFSELKASLTSIAHFLLFLLCIFILISGIVKL